MAVGKRDENGLTPLEERCAREYVKLGDQSAAFKKAHPISLKWKDKTVATKASMLFASGDVQRRIAQLRERVAARLVITQADVMLSAARAMNADARQLYDEHGKLRPVKDWPDDLALAVDAIEVRQTKLGEVVTKVKLSPRAQARDQLAKHLGWYERDNAQRAAAFRSLAASLPAAVREVLLNDIAPSSGRAQGVAAQPTAGAPDGVRH